MKLYQKSIDKCMALINDNACGNDKKVLKRVPNFYKGGNGEHLILKSDMAYELGGNNSFAIGGTAFCAEKDGGFQDEILLYGPDLDEIQSDIPYARISILNVNEDVFKDKNKAYSVMRRIDYTRYHMFADGYMMRISTTNDREPVRVGRKELKQGLNFEKVGNIFLDAYHKNPEVISAKIFFITDSNFDYARLAEEVRQIEKITESLNVIFKDFKMDCGTCGLKSVCDEVEGMRELHFGMS